MSDPLSDKDIALLTAYATNPAAPTFDFAAANNGVPVPTSPAMPVAAPGVPAYDFAAANGGQPRGVAATQPLEGPPGLQEYLSSLPPDVSNAHQGVRLNPGQAKTIGDAVAYQAPPLGAPAGAAQPPPRPQYAPVTSTTIPGKWVNTSRTTETQEGVPVSDAARSAMAASNQERVVADLATTGAEREKAAREASGLHEQAIIDNAEAIADREREQAQARALDAERTKIASAQSAASKTIDPNRAWSSKSVPAKIAATIALALGGFAAGFRGGRNVAQDRLDKETDDDIAAQRQEIESGKQKVDTATSLYGFMRQQGLDDNQATLAARIRGKQAHQEEIQAQLAATQDKLAQARGQQMLADTAKSIADDQLKLDQLTASRVTHQGAESYAPEKTVYSGGAPADKDRERRNGMVEKLIADKGYSPDDARELALRAYPTPEGYTGRGGVAPVAVGGGKEDAAGKRATALAGRLASMGGAGAGDRLSTAYHLERGLQGTDAHERLMAQDQWNSEVRGMIHSQFGARSPEAMDAVGAPYLIQPGDTPATVQRKVDAAQRNLGGDAATTAIPAAPTPDSFEEDER